MIFLPKPTPLLVAFKCEEMALPSTYFPKQEIYKILSTCLLFSFLTSLHRFSVDSAS